MSQQDIEKYVSTLNANLRNNIEIVEAPENYPYMLHGTIDGKIKKFIPRLAQRFDKREDRTVNRVHVSDNVIGCVTAMNELMQNLYGGKYSNSKSFDDNQEAWSKYIEYMNRTYRNV